MPNSTRVFSLCYALIFAAPPSRSETAQRPDIPKTWDEAALAEWATPLAGINVRPTYISAKEYYSLPVDHLKTYPVYLPNRELAGYWEMLNRIGPQPMIEREQLLAFLRTL